MTEPIRVSFRIRGRVQGVGFRHWMLHEAGRLGLAGFVRNRRDGSVEAVLEGPPEALGALAAACRRGPASARVEAVATEETGRDAPLPPGLVQRPTV